uniref:ShKT domain-containing protein n=1 Tax=Panagrolaimus sp. ES5 TaxID=591445 RepID=A0AC34GYB8_9BILA
MGIKVVLTLFAFFGAINADENCTKEDLEKITACYSEANNGEVPFLTDIVAPMFTLNATKDYWNPICESKTKMNKCIGKDRIQKCFTIQNSVNLPFSPIDTAARIVIASFIEIDHTCETLLNFSDEDRNCLAKLYETVPELCKSKTFECPDINSAMNCTVQNAYDKCGKNVGCFNEKSAVLQMCYVNIVCENCMDISVVNSPIINLCGDDNDKTKEAVEEKIEITTTSESPDISNSTTTSA